LDSTLLRLDSTFWLDSTLKLKLWCKNPVEVVLEVKSLALALALRVKSLLTTLSELRKL